MLSNFSDGFRFAIKLFNDGLTLESITHKAAEKVAARAEMYGRGMAAACEAMNGWTDIAEREARAWGYSHAAASNLVTTVRPVSPLLLSRIKEFLAGRVAGPVALVNYGSTLSGARRHGDCPCCRYHQFMSDYERCGIVYFPTAYGQDYGHAICERCVTVANS